MKLIRLLPLFFVFSAFSQLDEMTPTEILFKKMELQGIDLHEEYVFGYMFSDENEENLLKLSDSAQLIGYSYVSLEEDDKKLYYKLRLERTETHNASSMLVRKIQLEDLTRRFNIESYDGWDIGRLDKASPMFSGIRFWEILQEKTPDDLYLFAKQLAKYNLIEEALRTFDLCIKNNVQMDSVYYYQGICMNKLGVSGVPHFKKALEINPFFENAAFKMAANSYELNNLEKAIEYYNLVIDINSNNDAAYYGIAAALFAQNKRKKSKEYCQKALQINPENQLAQQLFKEY